MKTERSTFESFELILKTHFDSFKTNGRQWTYILNHLSSCLRSICILYDQWQTFAVTFDQMRKCYVHLDFLKSNISKLKVTFEFLKTNKITFLILWVHIRTLLTPLRPMADNKGTLWIIWSHFKIHLIL